MPFPPCETVAAAPSPHHSAFAAQPEDVSAPASPLPAMTTHPAEAGDASEMDIAGDEQSPAVVAHSPPHTVLQVRTGSMVQLLGPADYSMPSLDPTRVMSRRLLTSSSPAPSVTPRALRLTPTAALPSRRRSARIQPSPVAAAPSPLQLAPPPPPPQITAKASSFSFAHATTD